LPLIVKWLRLIILVFAAAAVDIKSVLAVDGLHSNNEFQIFVLGKDLTRNQDDIDKTVGKIKSAVGAEFQRLSHNSGNGIKMRCMQHF
jgi:hypothetical protein